MPYTRVVTALALLKALNEGQSLYNTGNRSYDGDAKQGASSVDIDAMPLLVAKTTGSGSADADRKGPDDTTKINVPLGPLVVPVKEKKVDQYSTNGRMMKDFIEGAKNALIDKMDESFIEQLQDGHNELIGALTWDHLMGSNSRLTVNKVPQFSRHTTVDALLEPDFLALDVVQRAMSYNPNYMENGILKIKNVTYHVTANAPKVDGKPTICTYFGPGVAHILAQFMDTERVYDPNTIQTNIDFILYYGSKLLKTVYSDCLVVG